MFGVGLFEPHRQALGACPRPASLEQGADIVRRRHIAAAAGHCQGGIAVTGGHIKHALAGAQVEHFAQRLADDLQRRSNDGIVASADNMACYLALSAQKSMTAVAVEASMRVLQVAFYFFRGSSDGLT